MLLSFMRFPSTLLLSTPKTVSDHFLLVFSLSFLLSSCFSSYSIGEKISLFRTFSLFLFCCELFKSSDQLPAFFDQYLDSPGASDNGLGIIILLRPGGIRPLCWIPLMYVPYDWFLLYVLSIDDSCTFSPKSCLTLRAAYYIMELCLCLIQCGDFTPLNYKDQRRSFKFCAKRRFSSYLGELTNFLERLYMFQLLLLLGNLGRVIVYLLLP